METKIFTRIHLIRKKNNSIRITKLVVMFLFLVIVQVQATIAQRLSFSEKNTSLINILNKIKKQTGLNILYATNDIKDASPISINVKQANLNEVLDIIFDSQPLNYSINNNTLVIRRKAQPIVSPIIKNIIDVSGKVIDENSLPLSGVTVAIKGEQKTVKTNSSGEFSFTGLSGNEILVFSYIGYLNQEIAASTKNILIKLIPSNQGLNEIVVVGYGTTKKSQVISSIATVGGEALDSRPLVNLAQGLQGVLPNLNINLGNGAPGTGASFNIRGFNSINGGSPLVLVDGVIMDPNLINPADVSSVSLLKDAGAVAIYGSRAAFGVLLITTKNPKKGSAPIFSVNSSFNNSRQTYMPQYLNSVEYLTMFLEADQTGKNGGVAAGEPFTTLDLELATKYLNDPANNPNVYRSPINPNKYRYVGNTDWLDILYPGYAPSFDNNVSVSGGQGKVSYVASLGNLNQTGLLKDADQKFNRYNASLKLNAEVTSWLDLNFKSTLNRTTYNTANIPRTQSDTFDFSFIPTDLSPLMPVYHPDGNFSGQGNYTNMVALMKQNGRATYNKNDIWLTGGFVLKPIKNFQIVGDLTWNGYTQNNTTQFRKFSEYGYNGILLGTYPWTTPDRVSKSNSNDNYHAINTYAEYSNTFNNDHNLKVMIGYNEELKQNNYFQVSVMNQLDPMLVSLTPNSDPTPVSTAAGNSLSEWAVRGAFSRINYDYKDRYMLMLTGRYDGSSRYAAGKRTVFTPSISLGWRLSNETFFESLKNYIDDFKFRGSYGTSPNQFVNSNYEFTLTMPTGATSYIFGNQLGNTVGAPGLISSNFTWEKVTTKNIGVDITAIKNKLDLSFDLYQRDTKDMLVSGFAVPSVLGTGVPRRNGADLRTNGWELSIGWKDKVGSALNYNLRLALSDNQSEITKYDLNPTGRLDQYYVGRKFGEVWGFVTDRFFATDAEAAATDQAQVWGGKWLAGDIKYTDLDGNGKIDYGTNTVSNPGDLKIIGNNEPRYQFGFNVALEYKGFDFTGFVQGTLKRDFWLGGSYFWGFTDEYQVPMKYNLDYWTPSNTEAYYPRVRFGGGGNYQTQTKYKQNAAYARIKQLTIGYTFNKELLSKIKLNRVRIYATGQNLFTITKLNEGFDPELLGVVTYPLSKTYSFGLQLGF